jgi:CDP-paratose 2-epimerase
MNWTYGKDNRIGDYICYYGDFSKIKNHYPAWDVTETLDGYIGHG